MELRHLGINIALCLMAIALAGAIVQSSSAQYVYEYDNSTDNFQWIYWRNGTYSNGVYQKTASFTSAAASITVYVDLPIFDYVTTGTAITFNVTMMMNGTGGASPPFWNTTIYLVDRFNTETVLWQNYTTPNYPAIYTNYSSVSVTFNTPTNPEMQARIAIREEAYASGAGSKTMNLTLIDANFTISTPTYTPTVAYNVSLVHEANFTAWTYFPSLNYDPSSNWRVALITQNTTGVMNTFPVRGDAIRYFSTSAPTWIRAQFDGISSTMYFRQLFTDGATSGNFTFLISNTTSTYTGLFSIYDFIGYYPTGTKISALRHIGGGSYLIADEKLLDVGLDTYLSLSYPMEYFIRLSYGANTFTYGTITQPDFYKSFTIYITRYNIADTGINCTFVRYDASTVIAIFNASALGATFINQTVFNTTGIVAQAWATAATLTSVFTAPYNQSVPYYCSFVFTVNGVNHTWVLSEDSPFPIGKYEYIVFPATVLTKSPSANTGSWANATLAYADGTGYANTTTAYHQHKFSGYGFALDPNSVISSVRIRYDAYCSEYLWGHIATRINVEFSTDGGSTWNANSTFNTYAKNNRVTPAWWYLHINEAISIYWWNITTFATWTPSLLNDDKIWVRVTAVPEPAMSDVRLDWIPVEVTYSVRNFNATISPTTADPSETKYYNLTITNPLYSNHRLGSANVSIPVGFTDVTIIGSTHHPSGKHWNVDIDSGQIWLSASENDHVLEAGEHVWVNVSATAPAGTYEWTTTAWGNRDFDEDQFTLMGSPPTVTVLPLWPPEPEVPPVNETAIRENVTTILGLVGAVVAGDDPTLLGLDYNGGRVVDIADAFDLLVDSGMLRPPQWKFDPDVAQAYLAELESVFGANLVNFVPLEGRVWLLYMLTYLPY